MSDTRQGIQIIYDGECPVCTRYTRMLRLRETVGRVQLVDARQDTAALSEVTAAGYDMDEGMVLKLDGATYLGAEAVHMLALLTSPAGAFNRLNHWLFRSPTRARVCYPVLRAGRNALLRLRGVPKIDNLEQGFGES